MNMYPDYWFWNLSEESDRRHCENMIFIKMNHHAMGAHSQDCTHCFGYEINKHNSGIIRTFIEKAIKNKTNFDWTGLHVALGRHAEVVRHNNAVMGWLDEA